MQKLSSLLVSLALQPHRCCLPWMQGGGYSLTDSTCGVPRPKATSQSCRLQQLTGCCLPAGSHQIGASRTSSNAVQPGSAVWLCGLTACLQVHLNSKNKAAASQAVITDLSQSASVMLRRVWGLQPLTGCAACLQVHIRQQGAVCRCLWRVYHHLHHDRIQREAK